MSIVKMKFKESVGIEHNGTMPADRDSEKWQKMFIRKQTNALFYTQHRANSTAVRKPRITNTCPWSEYFIFLNTY